jgi:hypothetical protein
MNRTPTREELFERMLEPVAIDPVLWMTPAEIRAELASDGFDVAALEREAVEIFRRHTRKRRFLTPWLAALMLPLTIIGSCVDVFGPAIPALPIFAKAPPAESPLPTATAAAPAPTPEADDGGAP